MKGRDEDEGGRRKRRQQGGSLSPDGTSIILFPVKTHSASSVCHPLPLSLPYPCLFSPVSPSFFHPFFFPSIAPFYSSPLSLIYPLEPHHLQRSPSPGNETSARISLPCPGTNVKILQIGNQGPGCSPVLSDRCG